MTKRRNTGPGISFFAFQDIITGVVGIFILILVILVLELAQRVETASQASPEDIKPVIATIATLQQQVSEIEAEIEQHSAISSRWEDTNAFNIDDKVDRLKRMNQSMEKRVESSDTKRRKLASEDSLAMAEAQRLAQQSKELSGQRQELKELSIVAREIRKRENVLFGDNSVVYRDVTEDGRYMVLVTLSLGLVEIRDSLTRSVKTFTSARRLDDFEKWLATIPLGRRHLLLMIEPGGESDFSAMHTAVKESGARYGFTVVGAKHAVRLGYELGTTP